MVVYGFRFPDYDYRLIRFSFSLGHRVGIPQSPGRTTSVTTGIWRKGDPRNKTSPVVSSQGRGEGISYRLLKSSLFCEPLHFRN